MIVVILEHVSEALRGEVSRFMNEIKPYTFVGDVSAMVRDELWKMIENKAEKDSAATMIYSYANEQGYLVRKLNEATRYATDFDGVTFMSRNVENIIPLTELWAKKGEFEKSILTHSMETGILARSFMLNGHMRPMVQNIADKWGEPLEEVINFFSFICAMHDIGKVHPYFQMRDEDVKQKLDKYGMSQNSASPDIMRHEFYGAKLMKILLKENENGINLDWYTEIPKVIEIHHQGKHGNINTQDINIRIGKEKWETLHKDIYAYFRKLFDFHLSCIKKDITHADVACHTLLSVMMHADWLASGTAVYDEKTEVDFASQDSYITYLEEQCMDYLTRTCCLYNPIGNTGGYEDVFNIPIGKEYDLQRVVKEEAEKYMDDISLMIIESSCGSGKTEAGLLAALKVGHNRNGICFCLPTKATTEAMHDRFSAVSQKVKGVLAPIYTADAGLLEQNVGIVKEKSLKDKNFKCDVPFFISTIDQVLRVVRAEKYSSLRYGGVMSKVLVIDELHAYDAYMIGIIKRLIEHCSANSVPVIILSATLPVQTKEEIINASIGKKHPPIEKGYPLITICTKDNNLKQIVTKSQEQKRHINYTILPFLTDINQIAHNALENIVDGGCECVIMNTVDDAIDVYDKIKNTKSEDIEIFLFHSRFPRNQKEKISKQIIERFGKKGKKEGKRPKKAIVVATQIIEQSMDIDFDFICSCICPIDLLLQRIGRHHRHEDVGTIREMRKLPTSISIYIPSDEDYKHTELVYEKELLDNTLKALLRYQSTGFDIPEHVRMLIDCVYINSNYKKLAEDTKMKNMAEYGNIKQISDCEFMLYKHRNDFEQYDIGTRYEKIPTTDIVIINEEMYVQLKNIFITKQKVPVDIHKWILLNRTIRVSKKKIESFTEYITGEDRMEGMFIFPCNTQDEVFNMDRTECMKLDGEYGLIWKTIN